MKVAVLGSGAGALAMAADMSRVGRQRLRPRPEATTPPRS